MAGTRKKLLLTILPVITCLLLSACEQNVRYRDASAGKPISLKGMSQRQAKQEGSAIRADLQVLPRRRCQDPLKMHHNGEDAERRITLRESFFLIFMPRSAKPAIVVTISGNEEA